MNFTAKCVQGNRLFITTYISLDYLTHWVNTSSNVFSKLLTVFQLFIHLASILTAFFRLKDATFGAPNILGNINQSRRAGETAISSQKITAAEKMIKSGAVRSVKINNNMTLYDANKSGKGAPRLRIRVTGLQTKVITPRIDPQMLKANPHAIRSYSSGSLSIRANAMRNPGGLAGMTGKMRYLNLKGVGGALTFAPSTAIDLYRNFNDGQLDGHQFVIDQAKHQSGNLVGCAAGGLATIFFGFMGAPVVVIGGVSLLAGIGLQALWNYSGMAESSGRLAEELIGK
jgi:hypothetical protein